MADEVTILWRCIYCGAAENMPMSTAEFRAHLRHAHGGELAAVETIPVGFLDGECGAHAVEHEGLVRLTTGGRVDVAVQHWHGLPGVHRG